MEQEQAQREQEREMLLFQIFYSKSSMRTTWVLAIIIGIIFLLEEFFGGSTNVAVLVRMGANVNSLVQAGEYSRLFTAVFLHAGFMHVFFNVYVLYALGGFFNRIFGRDQFLTLFFVSGFCGSLASFLIGKSPVSVGASGAIWGFFGASIVLAFFKTALIPEVLRLSLRRTTFINLAINIGVSLLPMVDMWAHFGGGIAGFLLSLVMIHRPENPFLNRLKTIFFALSAILLTCLYVFCFGLEMKQNHPWTTSIATELKKVSLPEVNMSVDVPANLKPKKTEHKNAQAIIYTFGDFNLDFFVMEVQFFNKAHTGAVDENWLNNRRKEFLADPNISAEWKKTLSLRQDFSREVLSFQQTQQKGIVVYNYLTVFEGYIIKFVLVSGSESDQQKLDHLAKKIIASLSIL